MRRRTVLILAFAALVALSALFALPFAWQVSTSLKTEEQVAKSGMDLVPRAETIDLNGAEALVKPLERKGDKQVVEIQEGERKGEKLTVVPSRILTRPHLEWKNYSDGFQAFPFAHMLRNTLVICVLTVIGTTLSCSLAAYGLGCVQWKGREVLFW